MNYTNITLGELLTSTNETIRRNAMSILKQLQREQVKKVIVKSESTENRFSI